MAHITSTDDGLRELALFAGAGGGILGGMLLGWRTVCAVEIEPYPISVLIQRQNDGILPPFPIWDDVCTFDGKPWRGIVDVVSGGFPCQDISAAGKGAGITGERSGLWKEMARIIGEVRPRFAFVENSPVLTSRGLDVVLGDLAAMGYDARWGVVSAADAAGDIRRDRLWVLASAGEISRPVIQWRPDKNRGNMGDNIKTGPFLDRYMEELERQGGEREDQGQSDLPPYLYRILDDVAPELDELAAIGNGQVPAVVRLAWNMLSEGLI